MRRFTQFVALAAFVAVVIAPSAGAIAFTDASYFPPTGVVGKPYPKFAFEIRAGGGCPPYTYQVQSGNFPPGLTLVEQSELAGLVTGTPTTAGSFSFWLQGKDASARNCGFPDDTRPPATTERQFTIEIMPALNIQQQSLKPTFVNVPYSLQLTAAGGGTLTWSINSGALPAGVTLSPDGLLSGTPTATGSFTFVVRVIDNNIREDTETLTLKVVEPLTVNTRVPTLPAEVGRPFVVAPTAAGGTAPYAWTLTQGTLPAGLTLDAATGKVAGTPTVAGLASLTLTVTDADGLTATLPLVLTVKAKLAIVTKRLGPWKMGRLYKKRLSINGGVLPVKWTIRGKLPLGVRFNTKTGTFVGTPRKAGVFRATVQVKDSLGALSKQTFVITVLL
jgi:large repetitive protein